MTYTPINLHIPTHDTAPATRERALAVLAPLEPFDVEGFQKLRLGQDNDGGYVMLDDFCGLAATYSFGINDDVSWDLAVARRGLVVHQYDHTIAGLPEHHENFRFRHIGLAAAPDGPFETLARAMAANGHEVDGGDLLLKCDIEGAEWEIFAALDPALLARFRQIVVEVHGLGDLHDPGFAALAGEAVRRLTLAHRTVHVHANNWAAYSVVGGVPVPNVLEVTLVRADGKRFAPAATPFPTPLDQPNNPAAADFALGLFRFA